MDSDLPVADLPIADFPGTAFSVAGHEIHIQHAAKDRWDIMLQMIAQARHSIRMLSYTFHADASGTMIRDALIAAAERGVSVSLIVDSFGSSENSEAFFTPIANAGGRYRWFSSRWNIGYFVRNHQKILIIDDQTALIGGYNIADSYFGRSGNKSWEDFGMTISGDQIPALAVYFDQLFAMTAKGGIRFLELRNLIRGWRPGTGQVQILLGGPTNRISPWARRLIRDLDTAQRFDAAMAYFSPSQSILRRIGKVAKRGQARLMLAGKSDNIATIGASRILYGFLLKRSAQIFEFQPQPLHMKLLVIDNASYIGSSNLDIRSLFINLEIMVRIEDAALAAHVRGVIDNMVTNSEAQDIVRHKSRATWLNRIRWTIGYFLVNSIDYSVGRRIRFRFLRNK
jgi:cardiolipin synthase A/B